jgi:hypothetical protein
MDEKSAVEESSLLWGFGVGHWAQSYPTSIREAEVKMGTYGIVTIWEQWYAQLPTGVAWKPRVKLALTGMKTKTYLYENRPYIFTLGVWGQ